jgi:hypothetical protein
VRSGDARRAATAAALLLVAGGLAGCVETTQQKNARATLTDARLLASKSSIKVRRTDPRVAVVKVGMVRGPGGTAVAVTLRNDGPRPISDLPVSVGVRTHRGRTLYLNAESELPYFQTHVGGLGAHAQATWVFESRRAASRGRPFARVGPPAIAIDKHLGHLPSIVASATAVRRKGSGRAVLDALVANHSDVAQSGLQVYAYAFAGDRLVAAGSRSVSSLGSGAKRAVQIALAGDPGSSRVQLQAPPANLR